MMFVNLQSTNMQLFLLFAQLIKKKVECFDLIHFNVWKIVWFIYILC